MDGRKKPQNVPKLALNSSQQKSAPKRPANQSNRVASRLHNSSTASSRSRNSPNPSVDENTPRNFQFFNGETASARDSARDPSFISSRLLENARKSGSLNLSGRKMPQIPETLWQLTKSTGYSASVDIDLSKTASEGSEGWWNQKPLERLHLSSNLLTEIPDKIGEFELLTVLDLSDNQIQTLPEQMGALGNLQKLFLSHNQLQCLPNSLGNLSLLVLLKADHNQIANLPKSVGDLTSLSELDLSDNALECLPEELGNLRVRILNLRQNRLLTIPGTMGGLSSVQSLDLSENRLSALPGDLGRLQKLETLNLTGNRLEILPVLEECYALKELVAGRNELKELHEDFFPRVPGLRTLDLKGNRLDSLPDNIVELASLERLNLQSNNLRRIPLDIGLLPTLKSLHLDGNPLVNIRQNVLRGDTAVLLEYLRSRIEDPEKVAKFQGGQVSDWFSDVVGTPRLNDVINTRTLDLSNRDLTEISNDLIGPLIGREIQTVNLSGNKLELFPENVSDLAPALQALYLAKNRLQAVPSLIGSFKCLQTLDLSCNSLLDDSLPKDLSKCSQLREINLAQNKFTRFPAVIYECSSLEILQVSGNKISVWDPEALRNMPALTHLDASNNEFTSVPPQLGLIQFKVLKLEGNPCRNPRVGILAKGTGEILKYLRSRLPEDSNYT